MPELGTLVACAAPSSWEQASFHRYTGPSCRLNILSSEVGGEIMAPYQIHTNSAAEAVPIPPCGIMPCWCHLLSDTSINHKKWFWITLRYHKINSTFGCLNQTSKIQIQIKIKKQTFFCQYEKNWKCWNALHFFIEQIMKKKMFIHPTIVLI